MKQMLPIIAATIALPVAIVVDAPTKRRFMEFFTANIRNPNTRKAYARSAADFLHWCEARGVTALPAIQPMHVSAWIEELGRSHAVPTVKQRLAALRHLFDWMVTGHVMPTNPAHAVRGPSYSTKKGKTPVLSPEEARRLLTSIPADTVSGKRDRALIGLMTYSFARIGAALSMEVRDVYLQNRRLWVRLHEKGGKLHEMPCHHSLEQYLEDYMEAGGLKDHPRSPLFRTIGRGTGNLTETPLPQANAYVMIQRRAKAAGIDTVVCCHTFRATGITTYLKNGGTLEQAAHMANHSSTRTTQLYDRRSDEVSLNEVERILI
ncbi:integrase [Rhizobium leguminosarum bv. viciae]|uniref:tyrosine-type recombinase/integrase n=1 Tax=Rhizobium TaxID=379 RepID=UPI00103B2D76|nr:tyrosine-type recombinase/integrase [Rhizobium leguminosarum]TBY66371.1 integrase [Rhizobium leguminosarum bv. viciae]